MSAARCPHGKRSRFEANNSWTEDFINLEIDTGHRKNVPDFVFSGLYLKTVSLPFCSSFESRLKESMGD